MLLIFIFLLSRVLFLSTELKYIKKKKNKLLVQYQIWNIHSKTFIQTTIYFVFPKHIIFFVHCFPFLWCAISHLTITRRAMRSRSFSNTFSALLIGHCILSFLFLYLNSVPFCTSKSLALSNVCFILQLTFQYYFLPSRRNNLHCCLRCLADC